MTTQNRQKSNAKKKDTNIDQTLMNSLQGLLNCKIGELDIHVKTTEYRARVNCIHM